MAKETNQVGRPTVKVGDIVATYIGQIPAKEKDEFGYPLGTLWRRCRVPGQFFVPHKDVVTIGKKLYDKNDKKNIAKARKEEEE
tara:strand:+ start:29 stop:280 length:252 start_codon:yes stop_codon:yes gene_type:complete